MKRRHFLASMLTAASAMVLDPDKLLWIPGQKTIFIPSAPLPRVLDLDEINAFAFRILAPSALTRSAADYYMKMSYYAHLRHVQRNRHG